MQVVCSYEGDPHLGREIEGVCRLGVLRESKSTVVTAYMHAALIA